MAEREGFEPSVRLPLHMLSRHADSAALAPLRLLAVSPPMASEELQPVIPTYVGMAYLFFSHQSLALAIISFFNESGTICGVNL